MSTTSDTAFDDAVPDFFDFVAADAATDPFDRPPRIEDRVPRDKRGCPRILPLGASMPTTESGRERTLRSFARPSGYAELLEDHFRLERWRERKVVEGMLSNRHLQLEYAALGDTEEDVDSKRDADDVVRKAFKAARAEDKADEGTGVHALTERHDLGLPIKFVPEDFRGNLEDWKRLTGHLEILAVECFVVEDCYRLAGTFDRLVRYHEPCGNCGAYRRILDLKTGKTEYGGMKMAAQLGIYAHSSFYDPTTGERTPLSKPFPTVAGPGVQEAVCVCRGIIVDIPSGADAGAGRLRWLNIAQGWNEAVKLAYEVRQIRSRSNWWLDMETVPDIMPAIRAASSRAELVELHRSTPRGQWGDHHTSAATRRIEELTK